MDGRRQRRRPVVITIFSDLKTVRLLHPSLLLLLGWSCMASFKCIFKIPSKMFYISTHYPVLAVQTVNINVWYFLDWYKYWLTKAEHLFSNKHDIRR